MKQILLVSVLVCAFVGTVVAGEMPTVDAPAPAPAGSGTQSSVVTTIVLTIVSAVVR